MGSMTAYHEAFYTYAGTALVGGIGLVVWGGFREPLWIRLTLLLLGISVIWGGLLMEVADGYRA
jgi:hypothetical protein